jgi:hypothetical protein
MYEWEENANGNYVYVLDTDEVITVFNRNGEWYGVYEDRFTLEGFGTADQAMALMEIAVFDGRLELLSNPKPASTGWRATKTGGYHCVRRGFTLTVKQAKSGKWYLVVNQTIVQGKWFDTADEAKREGDQY